MRFGARRNGDATRLPRSIACAARGWRIGTVAALFALGACGPAQGPPATAASAPGGWHEFQGSWNATGTRSTIPLGSDRRGGIIDWQGTMLLAGPSRPGVGFMARAIALGDTQTGVTGRAVWTDDKGDQVYSEFHGTGTASANRIEGTFLGGTGRYTAATGTYEWTWPYAVQTEDGTLQGRAVGLKGRVRVNEPPQPTLPASGEKQ
jgi:hypothetical protein